MIYRIVAILLGISAGQGLLAQGWTADDELSGRHLGLKLGTGVYSIFGGELKNPRPKIGFQAGFFWFGPKPQKVLNWQTGLEASFLGSNFKNEDSFGIASSSNYTQLGIIELDLPLLLNIRTAKYADGNYSALQVGLIPGWILKSVIYVGPEKRPQQQSNLEPWGNLPLQPINLQGVVGYQYIGSQVGYNFRLRASLLDMNDGFYMPALLPETGTGKRIGTMGLEFALLF